MTESIHVLMPKVMSDIGVIGKGRTNTHQNFKFRGIDDVMNALHEPLTKHGVFYVPEVLESEYTTYTTNNGTSMRNCVLKVRYTFYGPAGDSIPATGMGEASDSGDKSTSKALAMALKYALLQTFCIPTEEMGAEDADAHVHERAGASDWSKPAPSDGPACPVCGSEVWDNTQDPKRGKRPKWKCKDKACDFASWDDNPFGEAESGAPEPRAGIESVPQSTDNSPASESPSPSPTTPVQTPGQELPPWLRALQKTYDDALIVEAANFARKKKRAPGPDLEKVDEVAKAHPDTQQIITEYLSSNDWSAQTELGVKA